MLALPLQCLCSTPQKHRKCSVRHKNTVAQMNFSTTFACLAFAVAHCTAHGDMDLSFSARISVPDLQDELRIGQDSVRGVFRNTGKEPVVLVMPTTATGLEAYSLQIEYPDRKVTVRGRYYPIKTGGMGVVSLFTLAPGEVYIFEIDVDSTSWDFDDVEVAEATAKIRVQYTIQPEDVAYFSSRMKVKGLDSTRKATPLSLTSSAISVVVRPAIKKGEQDGAGQPATRPELKSEDSQKPQPEAEGRSR